MEDIPKIIIPSVEEENTEVLNVSSSPSKMYQNETVKFKINEQETVVLVYSNHLTLGAVKNDIAEKFLVKPKYLNILQSSRVLSDSCRLHEIVHNKFGIIELELRLNEFAEIFNRNSESKNERIFLDTDIYYRHYQLPDFFSVYIPSEDSNAGVAKLLIVEIINKPIVKPFLGGYVNNLTGIEYHDAFSQTGPAFESIKWTGMATRDSQTIELRNASDATDTDRCAQAFGVATELIHVPNGTDYEITPKKYESYDEMCRRINKIDKIITIQRNVRRYLLQKFIKQSTAAWRTLCLEQTRREMLRKEKFFTNFQDTADIQKTFPRTREDFNSLYAHVQKWKDEEMIKINKMYADGPRIAEINCLLNKEITLLNSIGKQQTIVKEYLLAINTEKKLDELGAPIKWIGYKNIVCEMDLMRTQKIRHLTEIYRQLKKTPSSKLKRIELIDKILQLLKMEENSYDLVEEFMTLLQREKNLLTCNIRSETLTTLRSRQLVLFVDFIQSHKGLNKKTDPENRMCHQCQNVRPIAKFQLHTKPGEVNICKYCSFLRVPPVDIKIYRAILRSIRRKERKENCLSSYAFIVQENDIRELIETIWHGHSILSQCAKQSELRLPRWNRDLDWSPWNCVCLTESEAIVHMQIRESINVVYDECVVRDIKQKHQLAKLSFKKLQDLNSTIVTSGEWTCES